MSAPDCRSDLVQRERRGQLSSGEYAALEAHLERCESCRMLRVVGRDFDSSNTIAKDDAERLQQMMAASKGWVTKPRRLGRPSRTRWVLAALGTSMAAAAATVAALHFGARQPSPHEVTIPADSVESSRPGSHLPTASAASANEESPPVALPESAATANAAPVPIQPIRSAPKSLSAEQLLQRATDARRNGDTKEAARAFRRLQQEYPASREASLSFVTLGSLLLEQGQPASALDQFNRYLNLNTVASLTAEALYGKGRALAQLGQLEQERQIWQRLLNDYPKSPYVTHAKRRLSTSR